MARSIKELQSDIDDLKKLIQTNSNEYGQTCAAYGNKVYASRIAEVEANEISKKLAEHNTKHSDLMDKIKKLEERIAQLSKEDIVEEKKVSNGSH